MITSDDHDHASFVSTTDVADSLYSIKKKKVKLHIKTLKYLILIIALNSCSNSNKREWTKTDMASLLSEKSDLQISKNFNVIKDSIKNTEGAFDLDYTYYLKIEYDKLEEENIIEQIINSAFFDTIQFMNYAEPIWKEVQLKGKKGIWTKEEKGFRYLYLNNGVNSREPFYLNIDTTTNRIDLTLIHL